MKTQDDIDTLISELRSTNGSRRENARSILVRMGTRATGPLIDLLSDRDAHVRWEAAKALGAIRDPSAAGPLAGALKDDDSEVRWLAAEALTALGPGAIVPVLVNLEIHFTSLFVRLGTRHILHILDRDHVLNGKTLDLLEALRSQEPVISIAWAAHQALESLRFGATVEPSHPMR